MNPFGDWHITCNGLFSMIRSCPYKKECPLLLHRTPITMVWLATYCDNRRKFADCARYALAATGTEVPSSLMPNGTRTDMSWQDSRKQRWRDAIRAALKR